MGYYGEGYWTDDPWWNSNQNYDGPAIDENGDEPEIPDEEYDDDPTK